VQGWTSLKVCLGRVFAHSFLFAGTSGGGFENTTMEGSHEGKGDRLLYILCEEEGKKERKKSSRPGKEPRSRRSLKDEIMEPSNQSGEKRGPGDQDF